MTSPAFFSVILYVDGGFARNAETAKTLAGREIGLWGYVDHGNIYGPGTARDIQGDLWSGDGPGDGTWRFDLKPGSEDLQRAFSVARWEG